MVRYLEVPQAEPDNNSTEHALRGVVLCCRNWLHVGQEAGGEKAANLFSLMITTSAFHRAAQRARMVARRTGTPLVVLGKNGQIEERRLRGETAAILREDFEKYQAGVPDDSAPGIDRIK